MPNNKAPFGHVLRDGDFAGFVHHAAPNHVLAVERGDLGAGSRRAVLESHLGTHKIVEPFHRYVDHLVARTLVDRHYEWTEVGISLRVRAELRRAGQLRWQRREVVRYGHRREVRAIRPSIV